MRICFDLAALSDWGVGFLRDVARRCMADCEALHKPLLAALDDETARRAKGIESLRELTIPVDDMTLGQLEECGIEARAIFDYLAGIEPPDEQRADHKGMTVLYGQLVCELGRAYGRRSSPLH